MNAIQCTRNTFAMHTKLEIYIFIQLCHTMYMYVLYIILTVFYTIYFFAWFTPCDHDRMVVGFTTTYAISA